MNIDHDKLELVHDTAGRELIPPIATRVDGPEVENVIDFETEEFCEGLLKIGNPGSITGVEIIGSLVYDRGKNSAIVA